MQIQTYFTPSAAQAAVNALMPNYIAAPYNQFAWAKSWNTIFKTGYIGLLILKDDVPFWYIDFEIVNFKFMKCAQNIGGKHANYHFPIFNPYATDWSEEDQATFEQVFIKTIKSLGIDYVKLVNQLQSYAHRSNPLLNLTPLSVIDHIRYAEFTADYETFANEVRGGSGRKRDRKQDRKLYDIGEWYCTEAITPENRKNLLEEFFKQKKLRLESKGIKDIFSDPKIQEFFIELSLQSNIKFFVYMRLFALYLNGEPIAINGSITNGTHFSGMFNSFKEDLAENAHPGLSLQREEIKTICQSGMKFYDLGAGDARYKESWLKDQWPATSGIIPINYLGFVFCLIFFMAMQTKLKIKSTPWAWNIAVSMRRAINKF